MEELQDSLDSARKIWEETSHQSLLEENQLSQLEKQSGQLQQQVHDAFKQVTLHLFTMIVIHYFRHMEIAFVLLFLADKPSVPGSCGSSTVFESL